MEKNTIVLLILIVIVIASISLIYYIKANGNHDEQIMQCIGQNSKMIISPTCSACAYQRNILKENLENYENYFEIINIAEHPELLKQYNLKGVPTWIINEQTYAGVRSIEQLKELTEC
ncbi:unnamed protein product [marine sediment metagenome]|uniref:Thioredoxin-like fold domain-containing protein n=1 Tax=marine sediment metagenome TaxID=412755 RepID=X0SXJ2_9ZZZZ